MLPKSKHYTDLQRLFVIALISQQLYCSEMNPIELEWQHLKEEEIAGRMFEDELDLAYAVMDGVDARLHASGCQVERFRFNSG